MIVYLDTSALVKLFVEELHSVRVRKAVSTAHSVATHAIAYVEACAAFAWLAEVRADDTLFATLRRHLDVQWKTWEVMNVTEALISRAADLAGRFRLRGYDSLHLAAVESAYAVFRGHVAFHFAVFDDRLIDAAQEIEVPLL